MSFQDLFTPEGFLHPDLPLKTKREITLFFCPPTSKILDFSSLYAICESDHLGKFATRPGHKPFFREAITPIPQRLTVYQVTGLHTYFISLSADRVDRAKSKFHFTPVMTFPANYNLADLKTYRSIIVPSPGFYDLTIQDFERLKTFVSNS